MLKQKYHITIPIFLCPIDSPLSTFEATFKPVLFVSNNQYKEITSVYFWDEKISSLFDSIYFDQVKKANIITKELKNTNQEISFTPSTINLGNIKIRELKEFKIKVTNKGENICKNIDATSFCNCVLLDSIPKIVEPNESVYLKFKFLSSTKGNITRSILVQYEIGEQKKQYKFKIKATVS